MKQIMCALFAALVLTAAVRAEGVDPQVEERIRNSLAVLLPGLVADSIRATPIDNLYEVGFGMRLVYVTGDGRYLLQGKVIDLETRTEITDNRLSELKLAALAKLDEKDMIVFGPDDAKYTITAFTDVDCGYCRKLHSEMDKYNANGIRIRYMAYPRAGLNSESYNKMVSVWCADDRKAAMNIAKTGASIPPKTCDNPIAEQYALGQAMRIQGTPALILDDGDVLPGYVPADKLVKLLEHRAAGGR
ncbi:MAG: thioredoxin fold domain-containing protein [Chromatiaceae bacterium]|nr:thioredoxin fold domain-containing protein [Gammaproteobacteria bacterium]MCP5300865.1 thioredoxin fold domain-containing protein [Chromatiaceae bacterium]MCP5421662.1 thioredoxin fold domain-containing protein [Chromatiaceae bacterium]